jgi:hypothetical protein
MIFVLCVAKKKRRKLKIKSQAKINLELVSHESMDPSPPNPGH